MARNRKKKLRWILVGLLMLLLVVASTNKGRIFLRQSMYEAYYLWIGFTNNDQKTFVKRFGIRLPRGFNLHGIDVSRYQEDIDWERVAKMNVDSIQITFAFIKATEGATYADPWFVNNWKNSKKYGIIRGAYHYYKPSSSSTIQAKNFLNMVTFEKGDLPPVLDVEETGEIPNNRLVKGLRNWIAIVRKETGLKPIIYTNIDFYRLNLQDEFFDDYPIWIAHYYKPKLLFEDVWSFWQHSDLGKVDGIQGRVDFNVFNGKKSQLLKLCKK